MLTHVPLLALAAANDNTSWWMFLVGLVWFGYGLQGRVRERVFDLRFAAALFGVVICVLGLAVG